MPQSDFISHLASKGALRNAVTRSATSPVMRHNSASTGSASGSTV
jgi:hypothetical protein